MVPHTCVVAESVQSHKNMSSGFIANIIYGEIVDNIDFELRSIIRAIEARFQYTISYAKTWRAKQKALESKFGMFEDSYHNLPGQL